MELYKPLLSALSKCTNVRSNYCFWSKRRRRNKSADEKGGMQVQKKDIHGNWKQRPKARMGSKTLWVLFTAQNKPIWKELFIQKALQVKNQLPEPLSIEKHASIGGICCFFCHLPTWTLGKNLSMDSCHFMSGCFLQETSSFPINWIKGSCKCSLQWKDFLYQRQEHMTNSDKPFVCEQLPIQWKRLCCMPL